MSTMKTVNKSLGMYSVVGYLVQASQTQLDLIKLEDILPLNQIDLLYPIHTLSFCSTKLETPKPSTRNIPCCL